MKLKARGAQCGSKIETDGIRSQGGSLISILNAQLVNRPVCRDWHKVNLKIKMYCPKMTFILIEKCVCGVKIAEIHFDKINPIRNVHNKASVCYGYAWNNEIERPEMNENAKLHLLFQVVLNCGRQKVWKSRGGCEKRSAKKQIVRTTSYSVVGSCFCHIFSVVHFCSCSSTCGEMV